MISWSATACVRGQETEFDSRWRHVVPFGLCDEPLRDRVRHAAAEQDHVERLRMGGGRGMAPLCRIDASCDAVTQVRASEAQRRESVEVAAAGGVHHQRRGSQFKV